MIAREAGEQVVAGLRRTMDKEATRVPTELVGLVALYQDDVRASAIIQGRNALAYQNTTFRDVGLTEKSLSELLAQVQNLETGETSASFVVQHRVWKCIPVLDGWSTLVCTGESREDGYELVRAPHVGGHANSPWERNGSDGTAVPVETGEYLDWTRFEVPGLSKFIRWVRDFDWASTGMGPIEQWPMALRAPLVYMMNNPQPRSMIWGPQRTFLYNEACIPMWGTKHPDSFGRPVAEAFEAMWAELGPYLEDGLCGHPRVLKSMPMMMERHKDLSDVMIEETYFDITILPLTGSDGRPMGLLDELAETTSAVRGMRRKAVTVDVIEHMASANSLTQVWAAFLGGLDRAPKDVPFALLYQVVNDTPVNGAETVEKKCVLGGTVGLQADNVSAVHTFSLGHHLHMGAGVIGPCLKAWKTRNVVVLSSKDGSLPEALKISNPERAFGDKVQAAVVMPIVSAVSDEVLGILILGLNPRCPFDGDYWLWARLLGDQLTKQATLVVLPEEQRRAQKLADELNDSLTQQLRITTLQVERSEGKFRRMAESAPTGMYMFDTEGKALHYNDQYLAMLGETREHYAARGAKNQAWKDHIFEEDFPRFEQGWERLLNTASPVTIEYRVKRQWRSFDQGSGQEITGETWLLANAFPEVEADGKVVAVMGWLTDISHRKFTEKLLAQKLEDALENKRQSENFIDMTSHEMRNPLSAILQSADYIVSTLTTQSVPSVAETVSLTADTSDEIVDAAQTIILCAQHQKRIVDDILTLSKLDASLLVISPDKVQPPSLVRKALKMYESEIIHAGIEATLCVEPTYEELQVDWVLLDSSRMLQVIINLITNAIKFTQYSDVRKVSICLGASRERPTGKHHKVNFIPVRQARRNDPPQADWGDGEDLYLQVAVSDTGRGLSEEDMKALFQRFSQANPKTYGKYGGNGLGLFISRELCELQGGQIGVASTPEKTTFTFFVKTKRWEVEQPDNDGMRPVLPRCASASASPIVYERRGSVYLPDIPKSVRESKKAKRTHESIAEGPSCPPEGFGQTSSMKNLADPTAGAGKEEVIHVLVVEDNIINQRVMSKQLRGAGCTVHVANHGLDCLNFLETTTYCAKTTPLSIVLLDLEMPTMDGLTCIRHIREWQLNGKISKHVPVLAVTANARSEQISGALVAGMDQVVTKPFRLPELMPQMLALIAEVAERNLG